MVRTDQDKALARPQIKRWVLGLLTTASALVGLAPLALSQNALQALPYIAAAVLAIASWELRSPKYKRPAFTSPGLVEFLFAAVGAAFWFSFSAIIVLVLCGVILGLSRLVELVTFFHEIHFWVDPIVFWFGVIVLWFLVILVTPLCVSWLREELYPNRWGARSAYYNLIANEPLKVARNTLIVVTLPIVAALVVLPFGGPIVRASYIGLQVYIFFISSSLYNIGRRKEADAIKRLLTATGYTVQHTVPTGNETVDPLLAAIDFIAERDHRVFAFQITTEAGDSDGVRWETAAALRTAALTYGKKRRLSKAVEPVMVLVGVQPSKGLLAFAKNESLSVQIIPPPIIEEIRKTDKIEKLEDLAARYLQLPGYSIRSNTSGEDGGNR